MPNREDIQIMLDLLKEMREDQKNQGNEISKHGVYLERLDSDVQEMKVTVSKNTEDVAEHMRRTDLLEKLHRDNQARIELNERRLDSLEEPVKARAFLKKHAFAIVSFLAALASVVALVLENLKK